MPISFALSDRRLKEQEVWQLESKADTFFDITSLRTKHFHIFIMGVTLEDGG